MFSPLVTSILHKRILAAQYRTKKILRTIDSYWDWVQQQNQEIASRFFSYSRQRREIIAPRARTCLTWLGLASNNTATAITYPLEMSVSWHVFQHMHRLLYTTYIMYNQTGRQHFSISCKKIQKNLGVVYWYPIFFVARNLVGQIHTTSKVTHVNSMRS